MMDVLDDTTLVVVLALALGLGVILVAIVVALNAAAYLVKETAQRRYG